MKQLPFWTMALGVPLAACQSAATRPLPASTVTAQGIGTPPAALSPNASLSLALVGFKVPGAGVIVVKDGEVVEAHAAGVTRLGAARAVDLDTIFPIGSNAKAFTATLIAMLVAEGRLGWDDKVTKHLPEVRFSDPAVTEMATIRDLLAMRTGVASDLMWLGADVTQADVLARIPLIKPTAEFRSQWVYSNVSYLLAGEIIAKVTGASWEQAVRDRIFVPLEMSRSSTGAPPRGENVVSSHVLLDDSPQAVEHPDLSAVAPAGDINSTLRDMAKWVQFQLTGKAPDGTQILAQEALAELQTPQMLMPGFSAYGMGWRIFPTYRGRPVRWLTHDGSTLGAISTLALVPSEETAVVVLANRQDAELSQALMLEALTTHLGAEAKDHVSEALAERAPAAAAHQQEQTPSDPPLPLSSYTGRFGDPLLGPLTVTLERGQLVVRRGRWTGTLSHLDGQRFKAIWNDPFFAALGSMTITFEVAGVRASAVSAFGGRFERLRT